MQCTFLLLVVLNAYELPGEYVDMLITHKMVEASVILEYGDKVWLFPCFSIVKQDILPGKHEILEEMIAELKKGRRLCLPFWLCTIWYVLFVCDQRWIRPEASPPASFSTSETVTML